MKQKINSVPNAYLFPLNGIAIVLITGCLLLSPVTYGQRKMEKLDRGVVASYQGNGKVFINWRLLATDPAGVGFNLYWKKGSQNAVKLNSAPLTASTNFVQTGATFQEAVAYFVRPVVNGVEQTPSTTFTLPAGAPVQDYLSIPLQPGPYFVQHAWPADLDGDGLYEIVVSRLPLAAGNPVVEAYKMNGTFMWRVDMGPNASQKGSGTAANDAPPASISGQGDVAGYRDTDNLTVYDLNSDGKAEVLVRTAPGVTFSDNKTLSSKSPLDQFISVIEGTTGKEITRLAVPQDYVQDGPLGGHFGIGYLDGVHPSLVTKFENRQGSVRGNFNLLIATYDFDGTHLRLRWKWTRNSQTAHNFHQLRILDVNADGKDDVCDGSYVINSNGQFLYTVPEAIHGDRFHITDIDPDRPGLEGYAIQQYENGSNPHFPWYYYDAATGAILRTGGSVLVDVGRGTVADLDPRQKGLEMWSYDGVYSVAGNKLSTEMPIPNFKIWWDGDLLGEVLNRTMIDKWDYLNNASTRLYTSTGTRHTHRNAPPFYGDILGDWREEVVWETADHSALRIYTTTIPTEHRLYTLAQNPAYRLCFTTKGYLQSTLVDYYLGHGMQTPPKPNIEVLGGGNVTGMRQVNENNSFEINAFPNPSNSQFHLSTNGTFSYTIYDQLGRFLKSEAGLQNATVGEQLNPGAYFIKVQSRQGKGVVRVVKQ